ncbi:p53-like transcription factor [Aulographum hederae CBS 113979]|uniref:p53-like transcription factor n=1 Tax=Aulographum hederae CBS 113979 TaxID=1176131 RepID=A0A6G1H2N8_9PEZI|nr:p53-like transcription factor [Aulographum hederae CBS 113979]
MNVLQQLPVQDYPLPSESECIDPISHAHHFAGGVADPIRRDAQLGHHSAHYLTLPPSGSGRSWQQPSRPTAQESTSSYQTVSDSGSGSFSTSPSSNASSVAYSQFPGTNLYQHSAGSSLGLGGSYHSASQVYNTSSYSPSYGSMTNTRPRLLSSTDSSGSGMLPPSTARSPGILNPVSTSLRDSARDNYTTSTPGISRHPISPTRYSDTPRATAYSSHPMMSEYGMSQQSASFLSPDQRMHDTPPFDPQETLYDIVCDNSVVVPNIEAKIEKGFFWSTDRCWTCYRRNYFSVQCSFTLDPWVPNRQMFLTRKGHQEPIQAMAMSLSAAVDGATGKSIELVQHTPKRDKGPQLEIRIEKVAPTPVGKPPHQQTDIHGYPLGSMSHPGSAMMTPQTPYLPLQNQAEQGDAQAYGSSQTTHTSPMQHQHTFERIQFKSATANNGKRRAQQQYYHLIVELYADVRQSSDSSPTWVKVAQKASAAVVVRGRSPSHYSNEGPHSSSSSRGGPGGPGGTAGGSGSGGYVQGGSNSLARTYSSGLSMGGSSSMGGGYRSTQYSVDPSPAGSHSVSSASSLSGAPMDGLVAEHSSPAGEETKPSEHFDGYQYYPSPLYDTALPPVAKLKDMIGESDKRVKDEYNGSSEGLPLPSSFQLGGCGRFQALESSRGYYHPDLSVGY